MSHKTGLSLKFPDRGQKIQAAPQKLQPEPLSLAERLDLLAGSLARARKYGTGQILFVVYQAETARANFEGQLLARLAAMGQRSRRMQFQPDDPPEAADLMDRLRDDPPAEDEVVLVYDMRRAFPGLLNSLNYKREFVPDYKWRLLFWAREEEVTRVIREAPDFWAFVNQTIELPEIPPLAERARLAENLAWSSLEWDAESRQLAPDERHARITLRERLLADLPDDETTIVSRAELHYVLGGLCYFERRLDLAEQHWQTALTLYQQAQNTKRQANSYNGLGNVYTTLGRYEEAIATFQRAIELAPKFAYPHNGLGNVYSDLGRHDEAIAAYQQAIALDSKYTDPHNGLGNVYYTLGRHDEAIAAYRHAIELDPKYTDPHNGLGNVYLILDRIDEAYDAFQRAVDFDPNDAVNQNSLAAVLKKLGREAEAAEHLACARELMDKEDAYNKACIEAISGNTQAALDYLAEALAKHPGQREWARRDPDLASLRSHPRFEALVGATEG